MGARLSGLIRHTQRRESVGVSLRSLRIFSAASAFQIFLPLSAQRQSAEVAERTMPHSRLGGQH